LGRQGRGSFLAEPERATAPLTLAIAVLCGWAALGPGAAAAAGPPQIAASWVENVRSRGATLWSEINPNGLQTTFHFEYLTKAEYLANGKGFTGAATAPPGKEEAVGSGVGVQKKVEELNFALSPATTYLYRPVATNSAGTKFGPEHELTTRVESEGFHLLDNRGWELVSPIDKGGGTIAAPGALFGGGDIQAAFAAPALSYGSSAAFGDAAGAPPSSQYVARRAESGWTTENVSTPLESGAYGDQPDGAPYRVFSNDLASALLFGGLACRGALEGCPAPNPPLAESGAPAGYMAYYLRDTAHGALVSLLGAADVAHSATLPRALEIAFAGASPDLAHVVLSSCAALTANATEVPDGLGGCVSSMANLYEWSATGLKAINLLPGNGVVTPGAEIAAPIGAVSAEGSRVYWSQAGNLYLRDGAQTTQVDESVGGGGTFQTASADGSIGFLTKAGHLYRYDAAAKAAPDLTPAGGVQGVLGASADGSYVYYQDAAGLELWHAGTTTMVAPGAEAAAASDYPPATGTARVSADGLHLAFLSDVELAGHDNLDADSGLPDTEVYLYGPPPGGPLICASCNPTGERPLGPSTIPGVLVNGSTRVYKPRVLSLGGDRIFFDSKDKLVGGDSGQVKDVPDGYSLPDVYEWEAAGIGDCRRAPGCVNLISGGGGGASFLDASGDGSDAFFLTGESLLGDEADPGSIDIYDARVGGGFAPAPGRIPCVGDACQSLPSAPDDPSPGTLVPNSGNPRPRLLKPKAHKHQQGRRHHSHHGKKHRSGGRHRGRQG
jgi:hypothetical protein